MCKMTKKYKQTVSKKKHLEVHLCDIFTCSKKNCISYDVKKFVKSYYLSNKRKIFNKCTQNVSKKKILEVQLCDIFSCSENCFSHDVTELVKTSQEQLSDKLKETYNKNTESKQDTSTRTKRACYLEKYSESENGSEIESVYGDVENDYIPVSDEEKEESEQSDLESVTETETETETESNSDTESTYCCKMDYEYIPRFEEAEQIIESYSESETETEDNSYSERDTETEDESSSKSDSIKDESSSENDFKTKDDSYSERDTETEDDSSSKNDSKTKHNSYSERDKETEDESSSKNDSKTKDKPSSKNDSKTKKNSGSIKGITVRSDTDRKRRSCYKRVLHKKKLRRWRLKRLMEN